MPTILQRLGTPGAPGAPILASAKFVGFSPRHHAAVAGGVVGIASASGVVLSVDGEGEGGGGRDLVDLDATLEAAGIVDGTELTVRRRSVRWC